MADLFLSYSSKDKEAVRTLADLLSRHWTVWWSEQLPPGSDFDVEIARQLAQARVVVVLWSRHAIDARWVRNEARAGLRREVLVPALLDDVESPLEFSSLQAARLFEGQLSSEAPEFQKLLQAIRAHLAETAATVGPGPKSVASTTTAPRGAPVRPSRWRGRPALLALLSVLVVLASALGWAWRNHREPPGRRLVVLPPTEGAGGATPATPPTREDPGAPVAIFHAFDLNLRDVEEFVCDLVDQGYSHVQIAPLQRSNPSPEWWARYQPIDYSVIEGRGSEADLRRLVLHAHVCDMKVIADVVFNHMADTERFRSLDFPGISHENFHPRCPISFADGNRDSELNCWSGGLPDLDQTKPAVQMAHKRHLERLLKLGVDGFRFDSAKLMSPSILQIYLDHAARFSGGRAWSYLEVIEDDDTSAGDYGKLAPVTDYPLYQLVQQAVQAKGDLRSLRTRAPAKVPTVTFGRTHDTIRGLNEFRLAPHDDRTDAFLATAFVLAGQAGVPLVFGMDSKDSPLIRAGVKFRHLLRKRAAGGANVGERILNIDSPSLLIMERGGEGFFVLNNSESAYGADVFDVTQSSLQGCYLELRTNLKVVVEQRDGQKQVARWGSLNRGGIQVAARDALYFISAPASDCRLP
jgi:alpha-amylase